MNLSYYRFTFSSSVSFKMHLLCSIKLADDTKEERNRPEKKVLHLIISSFNEIMNVDEVFKWSVSSCCPQELHKVPCGITLFDKNRIGLIYHFQRASLRLSGWRIHLQCRRHRRCRFHLWVRKIPLEKEMATHASILAWRIPQTEDPGTL